MVDGVQEVDRRIDHPHAIMVVRTTDKPRQKHAGSDATQTAARSHATHQLEQHSCRRERLTRGFCGQCTVNLAATMIFKTASSALRRPWFARSRCREGGESLNFRVLIFKLKLMIGVSSSIREIAQTLQRTQQMQHGRAAGIQQRTTHVGTRRTRTRHFIHVQCAHVESPIEAQRCPQ